MSGERKSHSQSHGDVATHEVPAMRDLAFSMLSLLIEAAAAHLKVEVPSSPQEQPDTKGAPNMGEARVAIDAANALLASVRSVMENDALLAIEGMLTQLQFEYVRLVSIGS
jgi:hypothetical protein